MGILAWIVLGLIAGALAKLLMPGKDGGGWIITMVLGIAGAFVGGYLGSLLGIGRRRRSEFSQHRYRHSGSLSAAFHLQAGEIENREGLAGKPLAACLFFASLFTMRNIFWVTVYHE
jgi:uncharacterized membrane protein YeaQ/YmgE (transglycosylase-associated protein family)